MASIAPEMKPLPIDKLYDQFTSLAGAHNLVITSPTGSGKSTRVPIWAARLGPVLVVEPRRVACRALASRVAELYGCKVGAAVGYQVRDERRRSEETLISFVTPGVAINELRRDPALTAYRMVIIDEFHERSMELDLLFGALVTSGQTSLCIMSATIDAKRIARAIRGQHLHSEGRLHSVSVRYLGEETLPSSNGLVDRVREALVQFVHLDGDCLVFLPGKGEMSAVYDACRLDRRLDGIEFIKLHGDLSMSQQSQVFEPCTSKRVVLSTNVAETSLTVPNITCVVDSGLVRQTLYRNGRGQLALMPIALDSAEQRSGRAGRIAPGVSIRLWSKRGQLKPKTKPEVLRESVTPLLLNLASMGLDINSCQLLDTPPAYSIEAAHAELEELGAISEANEITPIGEAMVALPIDLQLARWLVGSRDAACLESMVILTSGLVSGRPYLKPQIAIEEYTYLKDGCDYLGIGQLLGKTPLDQDVFDKQCLAEARRTARRLARHFGLNELAPEGSLSSRKAVALAILKSDRSTAFISRRRGRQTFWFNGDCEAELSGGSCLGRLLECPKAKVPAAVVALGTHSRGHRFGHGTLTITYAMPVPLAWVAQAGIGRRYRSGVNIGAEGLRVNCEFRHAGRILSSVEESPKGDDAILAFVDGVIGGAFWGGLNARVAAALERWATLLQIEPGLGGPCSPLTVDTWLAACSERLGIETGEDYALVGQSDFEVPSIPDHYRARLDKLFPTTLTLPDVAYRFAYNIPERTVFIHQTDGRRTSPPPLNWLPRFEGLKLILVTKRGQETLRSRSGR